MGFRLRRTINILPGIRLNIGKRGVSTSIGGRGAHITLGHGQVRTTLSVPGSGLSYTTTTHAHHQTHAEAHHAEPPAALQTVEPQPKGSARRGWLWIALIAAVVAWGALALGR